jgi:hypothetical protein
VNLRLSGLHHLHLHDMFFGTTEFVLESADKENETRGKKPAGFAPYKAAQRKMELRFFCYCGWE